MKSYEDKKTAAVSQSKRVEKTTQDHPKSWDRYIANRQKQVKEQKKGKS